MSGRFQGKSTKRRIPVVVLTGVLVFVLILSLVLARCSGIDRRLPVLTAETPQKLSVSQTDNFTLNVTISELGDTVYPAMSMSISFDPSRLEFLEVQEGNVFIHNDSNNTGHQLPDWSCSVQNSNETGMINIMYLDLTGGKYAFDRNLLAEEDNVVLRLQFRLRGSVRAGDVLDLILEDAVFAASDESQSLAMTTDTLRTKNGKIIVGE